MNEEIEALYALLGVKPDEASVSDSVDKLVKAVQSKLKSSIYGGKDGVIMLPATIEGKFKNGKEINQEIKDAYAAIYKKAQQMADESVSLTLNDIKEFKAQIDKFSKKTAKYKGNDIIANANNNLRQMLSDYQDFVNDLRKQVSVQQKAQIKQTQKVKAQQRAKTKKSSYHGITDEEIESNIRDEQRRRLSGLKQVEPRGYKRNTGFDTGVATERTLKATERGGSYPSNYARQMKSSELAAVKWMKKSLKIYQSENIADDYAKALQNGKNKNNISDKPANLISNELAKILGELEANRPDASIDQFNKYLEATLQSGKNGKGGYDAILLALNKTFHRYFNTDGTIGITDGGKMGVGEGHRQAQKAIIGMIETFKEKLETGFADKVVKVGEQLVNVSAEELRQLKVLARIDPRAASKEVDRILNGTNVSSTKQGSGSKLDQEVNRLVRESKNTTDAVKAGTKATNIQTVYDKNANVKSDTDMAKEIKVEEINRDINKDTARAVKADEVSGFNTDATANKLIKIVENINNGISSAKKTTSKMKLPDKIELPTETKDLYKKLADPSKILGLPKPDRRRKKISDGLKDENPQLGLIPVQNAMKKALAVIPGEFAKTLKEAIHPSVLDKRRHIDRPEGADKFEYDENILRRLADVANARKEARRNKNGNNITPPRVIVPDYQPQVEKSKIYASPIKQTIWDKLADALGDLTGATKAYKDVMNAVAEDQDKMAAERIIQYGMNKGRNPNDTGDIAGMRRILQLYRTNKASIEQNPELRQKIKLTGGRDVDTTAITKAFNKVLSGRQMRNAQMGGSPLRQVAGAFTGFIGMPSLEKSRAQADGLNQILGNINNALNSVLANIQTKETELAGLEKEGKAKFNADGTLTEDSSSAAFKTLADLEEEKLVLDTIKADLLANDEIIARTSGKFSKLVRQLSFTSPVLRDNNNILRNINAGLDKNGKALKFQTRMAEILNYTFQLISRSIGQWFKRIISMLNPLNIIKSAFQDFRSYDTKWQRTMNVIKINFQRVIKPAMEWIAQKLVNIIGFFNIISMKIQEAFGQTPVDLFDQAGANAEKMRRELEKAANVTAGFDELHDIGSDNSGENDLLGDIYKPQLSDEWKELAEKIGDLFKGVIQGDLGFGEAMSEILKIALQGVKTIWNTIIKPFLTDVLWPFIKDGFMGLLDTLLKIYVGWKLLKLAGKLLCNALFGGITESAVTSLFSNVGSWITNALAAAGIVGGVIALTVMVKYLWENGEKWDQLTEEQKESNRKKANTAGGTGGALVGAGIGLKLGGLAGGLAGGLTGLGAGYGVSNLANQIEAAYNGDKANVQKSATKAGMGIGEAIGAGIGTAIGGPGVGTLIGAGIGAVAGNIAGYTAGIINNAFIYNGEYANLKISAEDLKWATEQVDKAQQDQTKTLQNLQTAEEQTGIKAEELYGAVENGTILTADMTSEQMKVYDAYVKHQEAIGKTHDAQVKQMDYETSMDLDRAKKTENYESYIQKMIDANNQGIYSEEELEDRFAQVYAKLDNKSREAFMEKLPENMQQGVETGAEKYKSSWRKFVDGIAKDWDSLGDSLGEKIGNLFKGLGEGIKNATSGMGTAAKDAWNNSVFTKVGNWATGQGWQTNAEKEQKKQNDQRKKEIDTEVKRYREKVVGPDPRYTEVEKDKLAEEYKKTLMGSIASYAIGTNYVPNDGLAYLHQGEAVVPKKYNQPYQLQNNAGMENAINNLVQQVAQISNQVNQGIAVKGQFVQRGNDLVATVEKANNRLKNNVLNNKVYAR